MRENQKTPLSEDQPTQPKSQFEVKTFSEEQLYKIKKKNYINKALKYLQERVWLVYYAIFIIFFLGLLAFIVTAPKSPPPKPKQQQGMNSIVPAIVMPLADVPHVL